MLGMENDMYGRSGGRSAEATAARTAVAAISGRHGAIAIRGSGGGVIG